MNSNPAFKTFTRFIQEAPTASSPGTADELALIQSNLTKNLALAALFAFAPTLVASGSTYNVVNSDIFIAVTKSGALPAIQLQTGLAVARTIIIADCTGNCDPTNQIVIKPGAGDTVDGFTGSQFALVTAYQAVSLKYIPSAHLWKSF